MKFTQTMTMHLNGGRKFSQLHYKVLCDGKETDITRHTATSGSPKYLKTSDVFKCGDDEFDMLATKGKGLMAWLEAHVAAKETA